MVPSGQAAASWQHGVEALLIAGIMMRRRRRR
jgi:hypothetical protein